MSVNKVILLGYLGADPDLKYLPNGSPVTKFSLATKETWVDNNGQKQDQTEWHKVAAWGKLGENCAKYLSKGRQAYVEGKIATRSWEKDGQKHYATEIVASSVEFIGSGTGQGQAKPQSQGGQQPPQQAQPQPQQSFVGPYSGDNLDEIPF